MNQSIPPACPIPGMSQDASTMRPEKPEGYPTILLGGGCFWCTEYSMRQLEGVLFTRVGYAGGELAAPTYDDICTGRTGHAEVMEITYDPDVLPLRDLLHYFLTVAHDPTQLNRQGVDVGTQYRSTILAEGADAATASAVIAQVEAEKHYGSAVVTTIEPPATFWEGEAYHQRYYETYAKRTGTPHIRVLLKNQKKQKNMPA